MRPVVLSEAFFHFSCRYPDNGVAAENVQRRIPLTLTMAIVFLNVADMWNLVNICVRHSLH